MYPHYMKYIYHIGNDDSILNDLGFLSITTDNRFHGIEFDNNTATIYLDSAADTSVNEADALCQQKLYQIFLDMVKAGHAVGPVSIHCEGGSLKATTLITTTISVAIGASVKLSFIQNGRVLTDEEMAECTLRQKKETFTSLINNPFSLYHSISNESYQRIIKVFGIKDAIIKYFILYSWLYELCGSNQSKTADFIEGSKTYQHSTGAQRGTRIDSRKGSTVDEDIFTHLRNLIGHSINDLLSIDDKRLLDIVETQCPNLMQILLERLEMATPS